jgi:Tfp pilus assembly protein PilP
MTMRLAKASANLLVVLAMSLCLIPGSRAQAKPAKKKRMAPKAKVAAPAKPAAEAPASGEAPAVENVDTANKRDPFIPLVTDKKDVGALHLPPGKAGLVIATVRVSGTVQATGGMIAVVSNPEERVYFIKEGDRLYDGDVEKISLDGVTFKENTKDAFGKPVERMVTKRIYASAGEQQ